MGCVTELASAAEARLQDLRGEERDPNIACVTHKICKNVHAPSKM